VWEIIRSRSRWFNSSGTVSSAVMGIRCRCGTTGLIDVLIGRLLFADSFDFAVTERDAPALGCERNFLVMLRWSSTCSRIGMDWQVSIIGSQGTDRWELKIFGPHAFERSYTLKGSAGEHDPRVIADIVSRMVPARP
jgi:hypothetical protein